MKSPKKILITGAGGLIGSEFQEISAGGLDDFELLPKRRAELDITAPDQLEAVFSRFMPDFVINCAGYTNVDSAESEREAAWKANVEGPRLLAEMCRKNSAKLIHYSSNSVFDGEKATPYLESDPPSPIGYYGITKLEGERAIQSILPNEAFLILRITWPYGRNGNNFINNILKNLDRFSRENAELRAVTDQIGTPNPAKLLAKKTIDLIGAKASGIIHLSCLGSCSKFEFISHLLNYAQAKCRVTAATMREFPSPAKRPRNSALSTERFEFRDCLQLPHWQQAIEDYIDAEMFQGPDHLGE